MKQVNGNEILFKKTRYLILFVFFVLGAGRNGVVAAPPGDAEAKEMSAREITLLRRQMRAREDQAAAAFRNAETAFLVGEFDRAIEEFISVGREYDDTSFRMRAVLRVGDVYYRQKRYDRAISYYHRALGIPSEPWWPEDTPEEYARAYYMIGLCAFDQGDVNRAFSHLRRFVQRYPESKLVDRAYELIGRGNMELEQYGQAIEAFRMVGAGALASDARATIAPGEPLYVRVIDEDVGMTAGQGGNLRVRLTTDSGDEEIIVLESLGVGSPVFLGTIATRLGEVRLTRELDEHFNRATKTRLEAMLSAADEADAEMRKTAEELEELEKQRNQNGEDDPKQEDALLQRKKEIESQMETLQADGDRLRGQACADLDAIYAGIEDVLSSWDVVAETVSGESVVEETNASPDGREETGASFSLSDTFTQEQIAQTREGVGNEPTAPDNFAFRLALLDYWHRQLLDDFKTLDLRGGDQIRVEYLDAYGSVEDDVVRVDTLGIASDAAIQCVGPDYETAVDSVILRDELRVKVIDPDQSLTEGRDTVEVHVVCLPPEQSPPESEDELGSDDEDTASTEAAAPWSGLDEEEVGSPDLVPEGRPSFRLTLTETGPRSGVFVGAMPTVGNAADDPIHELEIGPEHTLRVAYQDELNASHGVPHVIVREVNVMAGTPGKHEVIEMRESQLDRQSELQKGIALGNLGRIYLELGLQVEGHRTFDEALKIVKAVVDAERGSPLGEEATFQLWDLYMASGNDEAAAQACRMLLSTFPNSPLAPHALLIMGKTAIEKHPREALQYFSRIAQRYPDSDLAPEALFMAAELRSEREFNVVAFESVAQKFPESNHAARALLRLSEHSISAQDYNRASEYLDRLSIDFPDFGELDKVTYMRGLCAYRMGDIQQAHSLMHEVIAKHPGSASAASAAKVVPLLSRRLEQ